MFSSVAYRIHTPYQTCSNSPCNLIYCVHSSPLPILAFPLLVFPLLDPEDLPNHRDLPKRLRPTEKRRARLVTRSGILHRSAQACVRPRQSRQRGAVHPCGQAVPAQRREPRGREHGGRGEPAGEDRERGGQR
jgi:hypothetical protein